MTSRRKTLSLAHVTSAAPPAIDSDRRNTGGTEDAVARFAATHAERTDWSDKPVKQMRTRVTKESPLQR